MSKYHKWSQYDKDFIRDNHKTMSHKDIGVALGISTSSVKGMCRNLGYKKAVAGEKYRDDEIEFIKNNYQFMTHQEIADKLNRTYRSIKSKCQSLGFIGKVPTIWTVEQENILEENYLSKRFSELAVLLDKSPAEIGYKCHRLKLRQKLGKRPGYLSENTEIWLESDINYIKDNYKTKTNVDLAIDLDKCISVIKKKLKELGLKRDRIFVLSEEVEFRDMVRSRYEGIRARCNNPNNKNYYRYGGRGIKCEIIWKEFYEWAIWVNLKKDQSIDRIDNNSNYTIDNLRPATAKQQANNTCRNIILYVWGESKTLDEALKDERCSFKNRRAIEARIRYGWNHEKALTTPLCPQKDRIKGYKEKRTNGKT